MRMNGSKALLVKTVTINLSDWIDKSSVQLPRFSCCEANLLSYYNAKFKTFIVNVGTNVINGLLCCSPSVFIALYVSNIITIFMQRTINYINPNTISLVFLSF